MNDRPDHDRSAWHAAVSWQRLDGESRVNYLRVAVITILYVIHSVDYFTAVTPHLGVFGDAADYHFAITLLAGAGLMIGLMVELALRSRWFPRWFAAATTVADIGLLTSVLSIAGGQRSPSVTLYCLVPVLATLRFEPWLVRMATALSTMGYLWLGCVGWFTAGRGLPSPPHADGTSQTIVAMSIVAIGLVASRWVRRSEIVANDFARRCADG